MRRLVLVLAVVLVNLPWVHQAWIGHRLDTDGRDVVATVVDARTEGDRHYLDYRLPGESDLDRRAFSAQVDQVTYDAARRTGDLAVRMLPGDPGSNRPVGETDSPVLLAAALGADAIVVVVLALWWWRRRNPVETPA